MALSDELLMKVEQPARYLGNEVNAANKDKSKAEVSFCMCFPDVYEIGMSHLGIQILYDMFNRFEDTYCDRVYSPWIDLDKMMREQDIKLFAVESQEPVKSFDFLGITLQYEMCYTNILQILDLSGIALRSADRDINDPFVIGGGPCTYNPEPIAPFFDLFYMGEGETQYRALLDLYKKWRAEGGSREDFLHEAAKIPGIYVPSLYDVTYKEDGTIDAMTPIYDDVPKTVRKEIVLDMTGAVYPEKPLVPHIRAVQDRVVLEIQRGCIRGCRFCQAGMVYRPVRERDVERLKQLAVTMLHSTGYDEISLSSLSSSDYSKLPELVNFLIEECSKRKINISLPSLRIDAFSLDVMSKVQDVKKSSLTFAPEAGTQRLRDVINKGLTEEVILQGAREAFEGGWSHVKLYFMMGLPTETLDDIAGIAQLAEKIINLYFEQPNRPKGKGVEISISVATFVPKPHTPFMLVPQATREQVAEKQQHLIRSIPLKHKKRIRVSWNDQLVSLLEAVLARGDRRLSAVIRKAWENGSRFDSWSDRFCWENWEKAFAECGLDPAFYANRERSATELLPWEHLDYLVDKSFFLREYERAKQAKTTPHCRKQCSGCGISREVGRACF